MPVLHSRRIPDPSRPHVRGDVRLLACGSLAALALAPLVLTAAPLETYGRLPHIEDIALSPDGTRVAFVRTAGEERVLAITDLATGRLLATVRAGEEKLR